MPRLPAPPLGKNAYFQLPLTFRSATLANMKFDHQMRHLAGYTLLERGGVIEIWHFYSDLLKHVADDWPSAMQSAIDHCTIARVPKRLWPSEQHDI